MKKKAAMLPVTSGYFKAVNSPHTIKFSQPF